MNIYKILNEITTYIDEHLEEKINYDVLAKIMGVNSYTMQKIFSLLTNIQLSEYIRKRRLSNAGFDLYNSKVKVMDVAIKYQYDNATSFSRAFENFHGIKPSMVNKSNNLKNFPKIIFNEASIKTTNSINYKVIERGEKTLYGLGIKTNNKEIGKNAPIFFKKIETKYQDTLGEVKYGMITYENQLREECNGYYVLYEKKHKDFEEIKIPASKWLLFTIDSQDSKKIQEMSNQFYLEFVPSCKYNLKEIPELEYYHDNITDFLVAID